MLQDLMKNHFFLNFPLKSDLKWISKWLTAAGDDKNVYSTIQYSVQTEGLLRGSDRNNAQRKELDKSGKISWGGSQLWCLSVYSTPCLVL
jgi:hypothetical protein